MLRRLFADEVHGNYISRDRVDPNPPCDRASSSSKIYARCLVFRPSIDNFKHNRNASAVIIIGLEFRRQNGIAPILRAICLKISNNILFREKRERRNCENFMISITTFRLLPWVILNTNIWGNEGIMDQKIA